MADNTLSTNFLDLNASWGLGHPCTSSEVAILTEGGDLAMNDGFFGGSGQHWGGAVISHPGDDPGDIDLDSNGIWISGEIDLVHVSAFYVAKFDGSLTANGTFNHFGIGETTGACTFSVVSDVGIDFQQLNHAFTYTTESPSIDNSLTINGGNASGNLIFQNGIVVSGLNVNFNYLGKISYGNASTLMLNGSTLHPDAALAPAAEGNVATVSDYTQGSYAGCEGFTVTGGLGRTYHPGDTFTGTYSLNRKNTGFVPDAIAGDINLTNFSVNTTTRTFTGTIPDDAEPNPATHLSVYDQSHNIVINLDTITVTGEEELVALGTLATGENGGIIGGGVMRAVGAQFLTLVTSVAHRGSDVYRWTFDNNITADGSSDDAFGLQGVVGGLTVLLTKPTGFIGSGANYVDFQYPAGFTSGTSLRGYNLGQAVPFPGAQVTTYPSHVVSSGRLIPTNQTGSTA